jgi:hypothetical protein
MYGYKTWSVILRGRTLAEGVLLRKIFGHHRAQLKEKGENCILMGSMLCTFSPNIIRLNNEKGGECGTYGGKKASTKIWWIDLKDRRHLRG